MKNMMIGSKLAIGVLIALFQGGCSILPPPTTVQNYQLPIQQSVATCATPKFSGVLQVEQPYANQIINASNIIVHTKNNATTVYKGARWNDTAPAILRDYLIQSLQQSGCLKTVISELHNVNSHYTLTGELYAFQGDYGVSNGEVRIHYVAYLIDSQTRDIISSKDFTIREQINENDMEGIIATFGRSAHRLSQQLIQWINQQNLNKAD